MLFFFSFNVTSFIHVYNSLIIFTHRPSSLFPFFLPLFYTYNFVNYLRMSHNTFQLYSYPILSPLIPSRFTHTHLLPTLWSLFFIAHQVPKVHIHGCWVSTGGCQPIRGHIFKIKADSPSPRSHHQLSLAPWSVVVLMSSNPLQA